MADAPQSRKILVVEDEESVRMAIEAGLDAIGGFDVHIAPDATSGMELLKEIEPEILLLDLVMPVVDGMEFLRTMKHDPDVKRPGKVVLMTALANPVPEGNLKELGLDMVLAKPFRLNELAAAVDASDPFGT
jgi:DNA-binding response OmpR family regulator